ncbi:hypothetical protein ACIQZO_18765 [Streptomyces sp. NPDC097617]|uniref:hypothetical protein n=1 Tax=Streptomyces sp. NPDC097617 TaxID=3366091 RepID=UPI00383074A6
MSTTRRPLGQGPAPAVDPQEQPAARGRTAAERAIETHPPAPPVLADAELPATPRRTLGAGARP